MSPGRKFIRLGFYGTCVLFFLLSGLCDATALPHKQDVDTDAASGALLDQGSMLAAWVSGAVLLSLVVLTAICLCCKDRRFKDLNEDVAEVSGSSMSPMSDMFAPMSSFTNSPVEIEPLPDITVLSHSGPQSPNPPGSVLAPFGSHPVAARGVRRTNFPRSQLSYVAEIGNGWFGKVLAAEASGLMPGEQKSNVIVRQLKTSAGPEEQAVFLQELQPNRELQHPNLLVVLAQCLETMPFLLIMEYCPMGDLKGYLVRQRREAQTLAQKGTLLRMACDMSAGLHFMHQNGFTHGDLALRNCMVCSDLTVKIGDYGLSHERYKVDYALVNQTELVPVRWMAPETVRLSGGQVRLLDTTTQANVWSFGVCLWELLELGRQPYSGLSDQDVLVEVITEQTVRLPQPVLDILHADRWYELMQFCWLSAEERPSMGELYSLLSYLRHQKEELDAAEFERKWTTMKPRDTVASLNDSKLALNGSAVSSSPDLVMSHLRGSSHSLNVSVTSQDSRLSGSIASGVVPVDVIVHWPRRSSASSSIVSTGTLTGSDTERTGGQDGNKASRTESSSSDNVFASVQGTESETPVTTETSVKPDVTDTGTSEVGNSNVSANNSNSAGPTLLLPALLRPQPQEQQRTSQQQQLQQSQVQPPLVQQPQVQPPQVQHQVQQYKQQQIQQVHHQVHHQVQQQQVQQQFQQQQQQEVRQGQWQLSQEQHEVTVPKGQQLVTHEKRVSELQKLQSTSSTVVSTVVQETFATSASSSSTLSFRSEVHKSATSREVKADEKKVTEVFDSESTSLVSPSSTGFSQALSAQYTESVQHTNSESTVEQKTEHSTKTKTFQFSDSAGTSLVRSTVQETVAGKGSFQRTSTPTLEVEATVHTPTESPVKSEASSEANMEESSESATGSYATPDTSMGQATLEDSALNLPAVVKEDQSVESQLFMSAADFSQTVLEEKKDDTLEEELSDVLSHPAEDCEVVGETDSGLDKVCSNGHCDHDSNDTIAKQGEQAEKNTENGLALDSLSAKEVVRTFDSAEDKSQGFYWSTLGQQAIDEEAMLVGKTDHNSGVTAPDVSVEKSTESTIEDATVGFSLNETVGSMGSLKTSVDKEASLLQDSESYAFTGLDTKDVSDAVEISKESFDKPDDFLNAQGREDVSNSELSFDVQPIAYKDENEQSTKDNLLDFSAASLGQDIFGSSFVPTSAKLQRDEDSVSSSVQGDSGADITGDWASSDEEEESSAGTTINPDEQGTTNVLNSDHVSSSEHPDVSGQGSSFHDSAAQYSPKGSPKFGPPKDELELYRERKASLSESQGSEDDTASPAVSEVKTVVTNDFSDESPDSAMLVSPYAEEDARDMDEDSLEEQVTAGDSSHTEDVPAIVVTMDPATTGPVLLLDELDGPRESTDHPDSGAQDQPDRFARGDVIRLTGGTDLDESTTDDLPESDTRDSALASSIQSTPLTPSPTTILPPQPQKSALKQPGSVIDKSRRVCFLVEGSSVHVEVFNYTKEPDEDLEHIVLIRDSDGSSTSETSDSEMDEDSSLQGEYDWGSDDEEEEEEYDLEWDDGMTRVVQDMNNMTGGAAPSFSFTQAAISSNYVGSSATYIPRTTMFSAAVDSQRETHVVERLESSPLPSPSWSPSRFSVQPASFSKETTKAVEDRRDDSDSLEVVLSEDERLITSP